MLLKLSCKYLIISALLAVLLLTAGPISAQTSDSLISPYTKVTLDNGLRIIVKEVHSSPIAAVDIQVGVGAKNESPEQVGISHFLEHMLFKGTQRRQVGEIAKQIQSIGGILNGMTSFDNTHYFVQVPSQYIGLALDVEADAMLNSAFDPVEIERERKVVLEEIRLHQDNPKIWLWDQVVLKSFAGTPYETTVVGTAETLNNINRESFLAYYHQYYVPNNMVIAVVGDVKTNQIITQIKQLFKDAPSVKVKSTPSFEAPKPKATTRMECQREVRQNYLCFGFTAPGLNSQDYLALNLLKIILGSCENARLYRLYGDQVIHKIHAEYAALQNGGLFEVYVETQMDADFIEKKINAIIAELIKNGVTDEELTIAKALLRTDLAFQAESDYALAATMSGYEINHAVEDALTDEQRVFEVTKEDVQRVAKDYLGPDRYILVTLKPKEEKP